MSTRKHCGVCGQRRLWLLTGSWWQEGLGKLRPVVVRDADQALRLERGPVLLWLPLCTKWCASVFETLTGGWVTKAADPRVLELVGAQLPPWFRPEAREAAEQGRAA